MKKKTIEPWVSGNHSVGGGGGRIQTEIFCPYAHSKQDFLARQINETIVHLVKQA